MENTTTPKVPDEKALLQKSLKLIRFFASKRGTQEFEDHKASVLNDLLTNVKFLSDKKSPLVSKLTADTVFAILRWLLLDRDRAIRENVIKVFRLLLESPAAFASLRQKHIHIFLARALERETKQDIFNENIQILKLLRKWIDIDPKNFPKLLANTLVSLSESSEDLIKKAVIENLRKLAISNSELAAWSGGIRILVEAIIDPTTREMSESLTYTLLYLVNDPTSRNAVKSHLDFTKIFSLFTDIDYPVETKDGKKDHLVKFENQLEMAKKAIMIMLKSWTGLIYLGNEKTSLSSLIMALKQPIKPIIRSAIYDIINEILTIGIKNIPKHSYDFQVNNLINYYLMVLVHLMMDCGLFNVLIELSGLEDNEISQPAQKYLKYLSYLNFTLLSPEQSSYPNFLISSTEVLEPNLIELRSRSFEVVHTMGDYIFDSIWDSKHEASSSRFLNLCENLFLSTPLGMPRSKMYSETILMVKSQLESEADDQKFSILIRASGVTVEKDPKKWGWSEIAQITDTYLNNAQRLNEALRNKFLKKLLQFFQPSKRSFVGMDWCTENFRYVKVGYNLIKILLKYKEGKSLLLNSEGFLTNNKSFMTDLANLLNYEISNAQGQRQPGSEVYAGMLNYENFGQRMIREFVSWIGLLSMYKQGLELLMEFKIFDMLIAYIEKAGTKDHVLVQILFSLDYRSEGKAREFLQYCLENGSKNLVFSCLELLRLLYRSELSDFSSWGMDLLVTKLYSDEDVSALALNVIEEICQDEKYLNAFLGRLPKLIALGRNGKNFLISVLRIKDGFEYLTNLNNWTLEEMERWRNKENADYVERVEKCLYNALDFANSEEQLNCFKFSELLASGTNSGLNLNLIYRLPWNLNLIFEIGDSSNETVLSLSMEYSPQNSMIVFVGVPNPIFTDLSKKLTFAKGTNFSFKLNVSIGKVYIDTMCKEVGSPLNIKCDGNDLKHLATYHNNSYHVYKNGITFVFAHSAQDDTLRLSQVRLDLKLENTSPNESRMPPHLFGELVKTKKGIELLKSKNYLDEFVDELKKPETHVLKKRAILWCLGHIGRSKRGINLLIEKEIIPLVVKMAEQSDYLSLRGTCLYILNLIANTVEGSQELGKYQWITYRNGGNMKICLPKDFTQFFYVPDLGRDLEKGKWAMKNEYWEKFDEIIRTLQHNEEQLEILQHIAGLGSVMSNKNAIKELKRIYSKNHEQFMEPYLFYSVLLMLTFYKFRTPMRRQIYNFFERLLSSSNAFETLDKTECFNISII